MDLEKRDLRFKDNLEIPNAWNIYLYAALKFIIGFFLLTLCAEAYLFVLHKGHAWALGDYLATALYAILTLVLFIRLIRKLPMAAIMLAAPTIPLCMLIVIVCTLPLLHLANKPATTEPTEVRTHA